MLLTPALRTATTLSRGDPFAAQKAVIADYITTRGSLIPTTGTAATLTPGTDWASSTLAGSTYSYPHAYINFLGGIINEDIGVPSPGASYPDDSFYTPKNCSFSSTERMARGSIVEFVTTDPKFEYHMVKKREASFRVLVNNQIVGDFTDPNDGNVFWMLVDLSAGWPGVQSKTVRLEFAGSASMDAIRSDNTGDLQTLTDPTPKRITWLGDSFIEGLTYLDAVDVHESLAARASKLLGFSDYSLSGFGGTGYRKTNDPGFGSVRPNLATRTQYDAVGADVIVIGAGYNDTSDYSGLGTEIATTLDAARAASPNALIYALGVWGDGAGDDVSAAATAISALIEAACLNRAGVKYLPVKQITYSKGADSVHPNEAGHALLATGIANLIKADLGLS